MSLVEDLRASRRSPAVLKLRMLKIRGEDPDVLIFFYEGPEDVPVYEEWMTRVENCPRFEPVAGAGKAQLLGFHRQLCESADPALEKVFFFVDRDFDLPVPTDSHLFELDAYSVENLVCTEQVLESLLRDEFRRTGAPGERAHIRSTFAEVLNEFDQHAAPIHFRLFAARRTRSRVIRKPDNASEIVVIQLTSLAPAYDDATKLVEVENLPEDQLEQLKVEFNALEVEFRVRGKYVFDMFRRWLRALAEDLRSPFPTLFTSNDARVWDSWTAINLRRLASSAPVPTSLVKFTNESILAPKAGGKTSEASLGGAGG